MSSWLVLVLAAASVAQAQDAPQCFCVEEIEAGQGPDLTSPTTLGSAGDGSGRFFMGEQQGLVWVWEKDGEGEWQRLSTPFLNLTEIVFISGSLQDERGFLALSFHPDHAENGLLYIYYSVELGPELYATVLSELRVFPEDRNRVDPESLRPLMQIDQPRSNHNGGDIFWGGDYDDADPDGRLYLYLATGDGGPGGDPSGNALNPGSPLGKIHRIDPVKPEGGELEYGIPEDNPFVGNPDYLPEIYNLGLRNPWRVSVDKPTGNVFIADVGQNAWEEIDLMVPGGNYGWAAYEAEACYKSELCDEYERDELEWPIYAYDHSDSKKSLTGGFVYRGCHSSGFFGRYIAGDWMQGFIIDLVENGDDGWSGRQLPACGDCSARNPKWTNEYFGYIQTFGVDEDGELYFGSKEDRHPLDPSHVYRMIEPDTYVDVC